MPKLRRFLDLTSQERWLVLKALVLTGTVRLGLSILPFRYLLRLLERTSQPVSAARCVGAPLSVERTVWAVSAASRFIPGASCLTQALTARLLLTRVGYPAKLEIGVAHNKQGKLEAHAWVEVNGQTVIGDLADLPRFAKFPPFRAKVPGL